MARRDLTSPALYHLWSPWTGLCTIGCPHAFPCVRLPDRGLEPARPAALIPPDERCGSTGMWPTYLRRPWVGPLPYQWPREKIPRWYVWWRLFDLQEGRCACCSSPAQSIDHDHNTGLVRGLLCISCNRREADCATRNQRCAHGRQPHCFRPYQRNPPAAEFGWIRLGVERYRHRTWNRVAPAG
ncbi:endonuclease domain-containing protein [Streptomyces xiamenensis]|uniref:endonuclease domain-containing protein n=1 Tax=Streptomyces xiamenensis TaxID=408015 RepID=UPI0035E0D432